MSNQQEEQHYGKVLSDQVDDVKLRNLIVTGPMDEMMASGVTKQLLTHNSEDPDIPTCIYINTYGGSVTDMLGMYDIMQFVNAPVYTVGFGKVMSAGTLVLAAGERGFRYALPNTSIMIHKVAGGAMGNPSDLQSKTEYVLYLQEKYKKLMIKHTKITKPIMEKLLSGPDRYLNPKQALELGIIDKISAVQPRAIT